VPKCRVCTTRSEVCSAVVVSIARSDGMIPPGKMCFWIQLNERRVARYRSCDIRMACTAAVPPGASSRSMVAK